MTVRFTMSEQLHVLPRIAMRKNGTTRQGERPPIRVVFEQPNTVATIMQRDPFCATPDMTLEQLAVEMLEHDVSGAPVIDESGRPIGVVSKTDLVREVAAKNDLQTRVRDAMTPIVYWLHEDATIGQASALMSYEQIQQIPIVDRTGKIRGLVSSLDIMRWVARRDGYLIPR
jgi:CBS domain-containing protein